MADGELNDSRPLSPHIWSWKWHITMLTSILHRVTGVGLYIGSIEREGVTGTVKFFNQERGFGFITPDGGGDDVFVHISSVERSGLPGVEDGMKLVFDLAADNRGKGPKAVNLKPFGEDGAAGAEGGEEE